MFAFIDSDLLLPFTSLSRSFSVSFFAEIYFDVILQQLIYTALYFLVFLHFNHSLLYYAWYPLISYILEYILLILPAYKILNHKLTHISIKNHLNIIKQISNSIKSIKSNTHAFNVNVVLVVAAILCIVYSIGNIFEKMQKLKLCSKRIGIFFYFRTWV